jgi:hypothetical protein
MHETQMNAANDAAPRKRGMARRLGKWTLAVAGILLVAHVTWVNSGSSEWKVVSDREGIRVSRMKTPGYAVMKYKVEVRLDSKLSDIVYYMSDLDTGYDAGATDMLRLQQVAVAPVFYAYDSYKLDMKPFGTLDVMIVNHYTQDPRTKQVRIDVYAAPNKRPADPGAMRIVHLSDCFTLTPLAGGGVHLELVSEMDLGIPYVLQNLFMPDVAFDEMKKMRDRLKKDRYRNGKPAFITELHQDRDPTPNLDPDRDPKPPLVNS